MNAQAIIAGASLLLLGAIVWKRHVSILFPGFINALCWGTVLIVLGLTQPRFVRVEFATILFISAGTLGFVLASSASGGTAPPAWRVPSSAQRGTPIGGWLKSILIFVTALSAGLLVWRIAAFMRLSAGGPFDSGLTNVRHHLNYVNPDAFGLSEYGGLVAASLAVMLIISDYDDWAFHRLWCWSAIGMTLAFGATSTGRSTLAGYIVMMMASAVVSGRIRPRTAGLVVVMALVAVFVIGGMGLGKISQTDVGTGPAESILLHGIGGTVALQVWVDQDLVGYGDGREVFRAPYMAASYLGLTEPPKKSLVQEPVYIPDWMNVYTMHRPYLTDLGWLGALVVMVVLGFIHGLLYRSITRPHPTTFRLYLYCVSLVPLSLQFIVDGYASLAFSWLYYVILGLPLLLSDARIRERVSPPSIPRQ